MIGTIGSLRGSTGYKIPNSLRFRSSASAYLSRTPTVAGNQKTWTWSGWVKRGDLGVLSNNHLFDAGYINTGIGANWTHIDFAGNMLQFIHYNGTANITQVSTTRLFRDASSWYHIIVSVDSTQAVASDRVKMYVNGVLETSFTYATYPTQNFAFAINTGYEHRIGRRVNDGFGQYQNFDGYLAEVNFIDGQALTPASFGAISNQTGVWAPKAYSGTYGTNGFYLKFNDNSAATSAAIGKDYSGNSNNWTPNNISLVAGSTYDSMTDTPTPYGDAAYYSGWNPNYGLQFRTAASTYLSRTPSVAGNRTTWTWSGWVKRRTLGTTQVVFNAFTNGSNSSSIQFNSSNQLRVNNYIAGVSRTDKITTATYNDQSVWYHVVASQNGSTSCNVYVNGTQITSLATNVGPDSADWFFNATNVHEFGRDNSGGVGQQYFDGYLAEVNFIDGQALTPSSFGETINNTWVPKTYSGTYGTNGFYLNFADRSAMTATAIGNDASINSNNWTPNNFAIADAIDYGMKTARGNYATGNPLDGETTGASTTIWSRGNLQLDCPSGAVADVYSRTSQFVSSGKWYVEVTSNQVLAAAASSGVYTGGIGIAKQSGTGSIAYNSIVWYSNTGVYRFGSAIGNISTATVAVGEVFGLALDLDAGTLVMYRNGTLAGTVATGITGEWAFVGGGYGASWIFNFGQRPFAYTPPTGFKALNTYNLPVPTIKKPAAYMAATTYTGTGAALTVSNAVGNNSFQPDLVWIKGRSGATDHALYDSVRGTTKDLVSNSTAAETTQPTGLTTFNSDGFGIGALAKLNTTAATYVAWQWKAGDTAATNTDGTISAQVRSNPTTGVSVVTYTGTGANATVGHGLGVAPKMIIGKIRNAAQNWQVWHSSIGDNAVQLNLDNAQVASTSNGAYITANITSSVVGVGAAGMSVSTSPYVLYCFTEIGGYSKFGIYTGNGSADGPFVYCGFRPKFIMSKRTDNAFGGDWHIYDSVRDAYNVVTADVYANSSVQEAPLTSFDMVSNGFKIRNSAANFNASGGSYIFAAFAEVPMKYALAR